MTRSANWYCNGDGASIITAPDGEPDSWFEVTIRPLVAGADARAVTEQHQVHWCHDCYQAVRGFLKDRMEEGRRSR